MNLALVTLMVCQCVSVLGLLEGLSSLVESVSRDQSVTFDLITLYVDEEDDLWAWANDRANFSSPCAVSSLKSAVAIPPPRSEGRFRRRETLSLSIILLGEHFPVGDLARLIPLIDIDYPEGEAWLLRPQDHLLQRSVDRITATLEVGINSQFYIIREIHSNELELSEFYRIPGLREQPVTNPIALYTTTSANITWLNPLWHRKEFYKRRGDLKGIALSFLVENSLPYCMVDAPMGSKNVEARGAFVNAMDILREALNFSMTLTRSPDGSWDSIVNLVHKGTFDGTVVDVGISLERSNLVDFSTPLVVGDHRIVIRTPGTAASLTTFTSTFDPDFWLVFCLNLLLCTTGLYLLTQVGDRDDHSDLTLGDCFALNCKICVWIGVGWVPTRVSARILFLSILFFGTVFWASYQAKLTAILTVILHKAPVQNLNDVLRENFELGIWGGTIILPSFQQAAIGTPMRELYEKQIKGNPSSEMTNVAGFEKAAEDPSFAYVTVATEATMSDLHPCQVIALDQKLLKYRSAFAFRPGFELTALFNHYIGLILESGQFDKSLKALEPKAPNCQDPGIAIGYDKLLSVFIMVMAGAGMCILVGLIEIIEARRKF